MLRRALCAAAASVVLACSSPALAWDLPEPPPIAWMDQADLFGRVAILKSDRDSEVIAWTLAHQTELSSGYLFEASRRLLAQGRNAEALEWYAVALMRGQYDAARCRDKSAKRAVSGLARQGAVVARYGHLNPQEFGVAGQAALARPDLFKHTISPDWVCAQGLTGMGGQSAGTIPDNLWPQAEADIRAEFQKQFQDMAERR